MNHLNSTLPPAILLAILTSSTILLTTRAEGPTNPSSPRPMVGAALMRGGFEVSVGEAVAGWHGESGEAHATAGNVQGILEIAEVSAIDPVHDLACRHRAWPNPATDILHLTLPEAAEAEVLLTDSEGRIVLRSRAVGPQAEIEVGDLTSGLYLLTIKSNSRTTFSAKIIKR